MSQKGFAPLLLLIGLVAAVVIGGGGFYLGQKYTSSTNPPSNPAEAVMPSASVEIIQPVPS